MHGNSSKDSGPPSPKGGGGTTTSGPSHNSWTPLNNIIP